MDKKNKIINIINIINIATVIIVVFGLLILYSYCLNSYSRAAESVTYTTYKAN